MHTSARSPEAKGIRTGRTKIIISDDLQRLRALPWVEFDGQVSLIILGIEKQSPSESGTQMSQRMDAK